MPWTITNLAAESHDYDVSNDQEAIEAAAPTDFGQTIDGGILTRPDGKKAVIHVVGHPGCYYFLLKWDMILGYHG